MDVATSILGWMVCKGLFAACLVGSMAFGFMTGMISGLMEANDRKLTGSQFWAFVGTTVAIDTVSAGVGAVFSAGTKSIVKKSLKAAALSWSTEKKALRKVAVAIADAGVSYYSSKAVSNRLRIIRNRSF